MEAMSIIESLFRWIHVVTGILWIGLLYFFNWVNANFAPTLDADSKKKVVPELMPRALYFFRWGAAFTWLTGLVLLSMVYYQTKMVFETPQDVDRLHGDLPGADIGLWLARHGLQVKVNHLPVKIAAGEALLSHAADMGAQLIVAGGYGHSRMRQAVLGGVTRTLMSSSPVPTLLSH